MKRLIMSIFGAILITVSLAFPIASMAEGEPIQFTPQIGIPDSEFTQGTGVDVGSYHTSSTGDKYFQADLLPRYIQTFYKYFQGIVGILAVIILMVGGVIWLTSAGDSGRIGQAKKMIAGSIAGIVILFSSWLILNTINPNLVNLKTINVGYVNKTTAITNCCQYPDYTAKLNIAQNACEQDGGTYYSNASLITKSDSSQSTCVESGCCRCKVSGGWSQLFISQSTCSDEFNSGKKVTRDLCESACAAAGQLYNGSESVFVWGQRCNESDECVWGTGGVGGSW